RRNKSPARKQATSVADLSGRMRSPLTTPGGDGIIRGLNLFAIYPVFFEELDGGQHTFRQKTRQTG
ncbi:hypothetical protein, partial [Pseudomonas aeruginosa]|uniref:hypothetical protein n=1 Tax=Pseudomonas aeruginosa TaxID=287 RepID=UPI001968F262